MNAVLTRPTPRPLLTQIAFVSLWLFVCSVPGEKGYDFPGIGSIARLTGLLAMGTAAVAIVTRGRFRLPNRTQFLMAAFMLWSALTYNWSLDPEASWEQAITYAQLFAVPVLMWEFCTEERHVLSLMDAYVAGTIGVFAKTLIQFLHGNAVSYQRYAMDSADPNDLALSVALTLAMSYYLSLRRPPKWRAYYWTQMLMACGTIFLTASRGGLLCMLLALSIVLSTAKALSARSRVWVTGFCVAGVVLATALVPAATWQRLSTLSTEVSHGTLNSRTLLWAEGLKAYGDAPLVGVGTGAYPELLEPLMGRPWIFHPVAHNTFLSVLVETGLIGLALFLSMLASLVIPIAGVQDWLFRRFWITEVAVWGLGVMALTWEHHKPTWIVLGLLMVHGAARVERSATVTGRIPRMSPAAEPQPAGQSWEGAR